ncbi:CcdB family protein [Roseovarius sp. M141]|uniref:CcdB family protein n=1 Tax=Roseovarius sp. M141 TaxID=2583806 RepID=UPI0020CE91C7|nr:CcdB family protein [Roseovarius sp. M141]MCQ0090781.1 hypothetical protein [Roseovarius sp. M141]MCQ0090853.1 hypothetical protein [Roseovarius sp. M141]
MAAQFDLYRMADGALVTVLQSDLLDGMHTRVVAPLIPAGALTQALPALNPAVTLGEDVYLFMPQLAATLTLSELGTRVGSLAAQRDALVRALDALLSGI